MKILFVVNNFYASGNGLSASARRTVRYLREAGEEVRVLSGRNHEAETPQPDYVLADFHVPVFDGLVQSHGYKFAKTDLSVIKEAVLWAFVAGNLFTGRFNKVVDLSGADLDFGVPFTGRPKSLSGYVHYIPKPVNYAKPPYLDRKGKPDGGRVEVILTDWAGLKHVDTTKEPFVDADKDPHLIARAVLDLDKDTGGYIPFEITFHYRNGKTPRYAFIYVTPSRDGGSFTGGSGSTLYVDEFRFNY